VSGLILIGAGGHGRVVAEACGRLGMPLVAYADPHVASWLDVPHFSNENDAASAHPHAGFALGLAGTSPDALVRRRAVFQTLLPLSRPVTLVHPDASLADNARIGAGAQVMALARVAADAWVGEGAIINTGAIVEHGVRIGAFAHVAPGAIILGDASIGEAAMIGAGAIVLPGAVVDAGAMIKAGTRVPR
jgi:sugar O-acyltransferase (sialic acid O-acetyltransferase NeuD family)